MQTQDEFIKIAAALNDETRVLILAYLLRHGELCVCDLQESLGMIQSRLSRHLKILKEAGLLSMRKSGTWSYFSIAPSLDVCRDDKDCMDLDCNKPLVSFQKAALQAIATLQIPLPPLQNTHCEKAKQNALSIAFLCVHNSCRSIMAQALAEHRAKEIGLPLLVYSAGSAPSGVINKKVGESLRKLYGISIKNYSSKGLDSIPHNLDIAVSMGCGVQCPQIQAKRHLDFGLQDPSDYDEKSFDEFVISLKNRIDTLLFELKENHEKYR